MSILTPGQITPWGQLRSIYTGRKPTAYIPVEPGLGADNPAAVAPAGTVHCALGDWGKFVAEAMRGAQGDGKLASKSTYEQIFAPGLSDYGFGWAILQRQWAGGLALTHGGSNTMFFALVWAAPAKGRAFLAATNAGDGDAFAAVDAVIAELRTIQGLVE